MQTFTTYLLKTVIRKSIYCPANACRTSKRFRLFQDVGNWIKAISKPLTVTCSRMVLMFSFQIHYISSGLLAACGGVSEHAHTCINIYVCTNTHAQCLFTMPSLLACLLDSAFVCVNKQTLRGSLLARLHQGLTELTF